MKNYKTKSKLFGYQIGLNNDNLYVAVPSKYFTNNQSINILVMNENIIELSKLVTINDKEQEVTLKDKFKLNNNYLIYYFRIKEY